MTTTQKRASLEGVMPFFIVEQLDATLDFYVQRLGFSVDVMLPVDAPHFAIVQRDRVGIMLKEIGKEIRPQPNHTRHGWVRWDVYFYTPDPDTLFEEFQVKNVPVHRPISDTEDGLRAFEIFDNNGYVLCFGRPK
jgi:catechol 2,3-dioxygenase-like lactoylglutathione lyase family enzyme